MSNEIRILLWILLILVLLGLITFLVLWLFFRKWSCKNGTCSRRIGGDYSEQSECDKNCKLPSVSAPQPMGYNCIKTGNDYDCELQPNGDYPSHQACWDQCGSQVVSSPYPVYVGGYIGG